jgi:DNA polymerase-4
MWAELHDSRDEARRTVEEIRTELWKQLCLTVSVGVANNLPYAKLGSDLAPNNGVYEMWNDERETRVYPLPVSDLLYVGPATTKKFHSNGIYTIGDLAYSKPEDICRILRNKTGEVLWTMAIGRDQTPVASEESISDIKSIGHSNTMPRDLVNDSDVKAAFYMLGEAVSQRLREHGFEAATVKIYIRDNELFSFERQMRLPRPTNLVSELIPAAIALFKQNHQWYRPVRSLGLRGADLLPADGVYQVSLFDNEEERKKIERWERCIDRIRERYGYFSVQRAVLMHENLKSPNANNNIGDAQIFYSYR